MFVSFLFARRMTVSAYQLESFDPLPAGNSGAGIDGNWYYTNIDEVVVNGKSQWNSLRIGIYCVKDSLVRRVGEYIRPYHQQFRTFCPFVRNGKEYALYSKSYTKTSVMSLPDCTYICSDNSLPNPSGHMLDFCPTDLWVPREVEDEELFDIERDDYKVVQLPCDFGFVAGCVWGDDTSYKIQYLDLTQIEQGKLIREERFGYIHMLENSNLEDSISMQAFRGVISTVHITHVTSFRLSDGKNWDS